MGRKPPLGRRSKKGGRHHVSWNVSLFEGQRLTPPRIGPALRTDITIWLFADKGRAFVNGYPRDRQVTIRSDWTEIILTVGSTTARVNGVAVTLDAPPVVFNNRSTCRSASSARLWA